MTPRFATITASLLLAAAMLHGCLAAQLKEGTMRACAESQVVVDQCRADVTCTGATLTNERGEVYGVLEALETNAEQACRTHDAVVGRRPSR